MDVDGRMRELASLLQDAGINDVKFPDAKPEMEHDWHKNYAVIQDVYYDDFGWDDGARNYFNGPQFIYDMKQFVKAHFAGDPSIEVHFHGEDETGCMEIEAYRNNGHRVEQPTTAPSPSEAQS